MLCIHGSTNCITLSSEKKFKNRAHGQRFSVRTAQTLWLGEKALRWPLPIKLHIHSQNISPCLVIHHPSLPNLGIRKQSRETEEQVLIPSTTNLLPWDHDQTTKHILPPHSHWKSGEEALPPLGEEGLYGAGLRRVSGKRLLDATGVITRAEQTTCLKLQSEHQQPKSWERYWKNIKLKVYLLKNTLSSDQAQHCLASSIIFSVTHRRSQEHQMRGMLRRMENEAGTVNFWNRWSEDAVCQRGTRGGLESLGAQQTWPKARECVIL